jgi:hypothetical protein
LPGSKFACRIKPLMAPNVTWSPAGGALVAYLSDGEDKKKTKN